METIFFWMTGALICGQIFRLLSLPIIVGFIFSGYLFSIFNFEETNKLLDLPAELGVELLLFSIGLKIKPSYFLNLYFFSFFYSYWNFNFNLFCFSNLWYQHFSIFDVVCFINAIKHCYCFKSVRWQKWIKNFSW